MNRRPFAMLMFGATVVLALWAVARLADVSAPFPSWRQPAVVSPTAPATTPTTTPITLPRTLRTMQVGTP